VSVCVIIPNFEGIGRMIAEIRRFKWRLSAILELLRACLDHDEEYLVVTVQNLIGIDEVVSIILKF